jgi:hypothetical protein
MFHMVVVFEMRGITTLGRIEHQHMRSIGATSVFVLKWYAAPWTSDVVLDFLFLCMANQKSVTPTFDRLIGGG